MALSGELRSYNPSWRDQLATMLMGDSRQSSQWRQFVHGMLGSTGLGTTQASLADASPLAIPFGLQEGTRASDAGNPMEAVFNYAGAIPGVKAAEKIANAAVRVGGRLFEGATHTKALEEAAWQLKRPIDEIIDSTPVEDLGLFLTSSGRPVGRKEAHEIALGEKQVVGENPDWRGRATNVPEGQLTSEALGKYGIAGLTAGAGGAALAASGGEAKAQEKMAPRDLLAARPAAKAGPRDLLAKPEKAAGPNVAQGETQTAAQHYQTWPERFLRGVVETLVNAGRGTESAMTTGEANLGDIVGGALLGTPAGAARGSGRTLAREAVAGRGTGRNTPQGGIIQQGPMTGQIIPPNGANPLPFSQPGQTVRGAPAPPVKKPMQTTVEAFDRSGVEPTLPMATPNRAIGTSARVLGNTIVGGRLPRGINTAIGQAGARAGTLANARSSVTSPATAGENVISGIKQFEQAGDIKKSGLYATVENRIDPNVLSTLSHTRGSMDTLDRAIENPEIRSFLTDPNLQETFGMLRSAAQGGISFGDLQAVRSAIGKLQPSAESKVGINKRGLKTLYSSLTKDLEALAREAGGEPAVKALKDADSYTRALEAVRLPEVKGLLGQNGEQVFQTIQRLASERGGADWKRLAQVRRSVGDQAWKDMAAVTVRNLGRKGDIEFDPSSFLQNYGKLSPKGREMLFDKDLRSALDDLEIVSRGIANASKGGITSLGHRLNITSALGVGTAFFAPALLKAAVPAYAITQVMTQPAIVRWLAGVTRARGQRSKLETLFGRINDLSGGDKEMGDVLRRIGAAALNDRDEKPAGNPATVGGGKPSPAASPRSLQKGSSLLNMLNPISSANAAEVPQTLEDTLHAWASGKASSAQVQKAFKKLGYSVNLRKPGNPVEVFTPDGKAIDLGF